MEEEEGELAAVTLVEMGEDLVTSGRSLLILTLESPLLEVEEEQALTAMALMEEG
jgi:hypothetical protein